MHFRASVDLAITYTFKRCALYMVANIITPLHQQNVIPPAHHDEDVWTVAEQFLIAHNLCNFIELCLCTLLKGNSSCMIYEYEATAMHWVQIGTYKYSIQRKCVPQGMYCSMDWIHECLMLWLCMNSCSL